MKVYLNELYQDYSFSPSFKWLIFKMAGLFLRKENLCWAELCITVTDDEHLAELNEKYRGKKGPTDVISFVYRENTDKTEPIGQNDNILGEIYISLEQAIKQARADRTTTERRLLNLLAHGLCHLAGYHHRNGKETFLMKEKEKQMLLSVTGKSPGRLPKWKK